MSPSLLAVRWPALHGALPAALLLLALAAPSRAQAGPEDRPDAPGVGAPSADAALLTPDAPRAEASIAARRAAIVATARAYAEHVWRASEANVLHGPAEDGVHVDTPDAGHRPDGWKADGSDNVGIPYKWGGFDSLESFDAGVAAGSPAGELTDGQDLDASQHSVGVDCSGFVARCWDLPFKQSTRSLGQLSFELDDYGELLPGDLINKYDAHAMVFVEFADDARGSVRVIEAGFPRVTESVHPVDALAAAGFRPFRYKPLDPRWVEADPAPAAFEAGDEPGRWVPAEDAPPLDEAARDALLARLAARLAAAEPGDWVRCRVGNAAESTPLVVTRVVSASGPQGVEIQTTSTLGEHDLQTLKTQPAAATLAERLLALKDDAQPLDAVTTVAAAVSPGVWECAGRRFAGHRIELSVDARLTARGQGLELDIAFDVIACDELPLEGVARVQSQTTYQLDSGPATVTGFRELTAFGR